MGFKIFEKIDDSGIHMVPTDKDNLSTEMIAPQPNDYVIPALIEQFEKIIGFNSKFDFSSSLSYFRNKNVKRIIDRIDTLLLDRFGIAFKHISSDGIGYAVYSVPPKNNSNLKRSIEDHYNDVESYLKNLKGGNKEISEIIDTRQDETAIIKNWYKSINALEKTLNTKGVNIDLQNAKISGLPKDYVVFAMFDPYNLINRAELDAKELVSVLMHEIGHGFTQLEYSYRTVRTTSVLIDSVQDSLLKKNKSFKDTIKIAYEEALDGNPMDLDKVNTITALIKLGDKYIIDSRYPNEAIHSGTDSEQLADQFAGRFGLGVEIGLALIKLKKLDITVGMTVTVLTPLLLITTIYSILLVGGLMGGLLVELVIVAIFIFVWLIQDVVESMFTTGGTGIEQTYDSDKQRFQRIKNELIRQIRTSKLDKKLASKMLDDITTLNKFISVAKDEYKSASWSDKLYRIFSSSAKHNMLMKEIEQTTEDLMENDLYTMSLKLKTIKG